MVKRRREAFLFIYIKLAKLDSETSSSQRLIPIYQGQNEGNCP